MKIILLFLLTIFTFINISAQTQKYYTRLNINNISTIFWNNGNSDLHPSGKPGLIYPKGSGKGSVYVTGLLWGLKIKDMNEPLIGGSAYRSGLRPGRINSEGIADDPLSENNRIYRVRRDVFPGSTDNDFTSEVNDEEGLKADIRMQYEKDWNEWPAYNGAPFEDKNSNGIYEPDTDIPGESGAAQTIWFVANDLDNQNVIYLAGSVSAGIEMQATYWAYTFPEDFKNVIYRRYLLINKSANNFDSMYVALFSDSDIGYSGDDFAGCDTILNMGYTYNAKKHDAIYLDSPTAVGFDILQGPLVKGVAGEDRNKNGIDDYNDNGHSNGKVTPKGFLNLPMASFFYFRTGVAIGEDAPKASHWYNFMQGRNGYETMPFINPIDSNVTVFPLSGDPTKLANKGWVDGIVDQPADRRIGVSSGPFQMAVADTQEIIFAEIVAGNHPLVNNIEAITILKFYDKEVQTFFNSNFVTNTKEDNIKAPENFSLSQNYPNPFNPSTRINWQSPVGSWQTLKVYDVLGNEVATLIDEEKPAGEYEIEFDASELSSGIYFYQIKAGTNIQTNKMILMK